MAAKKNGITGKQQKFIEEYLVDLNATQAAIRAGYSAKWADRQAHKLIENSRVSARVREAIEARSKRTEVTQDDVIVGLLEAIEKAYEMKQSMAAVKSLELLGKHLGMFTDRVDIGVADNVAEILRRARERRKGGTGSTND